MNTKKLIVALVIVFLFVTVVGASTNYEVYIPLLMGGSVPESTPTAPPGQCPQDGSYLSGKIGITVEDCVIVHITFWAWACDVLVVYFTDPIPIVNGKFDVTGALYEGTLNINGEFTDKVRGFYYLEKHSLYLCESSGAWSATWQDPSITPSPTPTPTVTPTPTLEPCRWNGEYAGSDINITVE
ncbi:MAG: hypothetical protein AB8I56_16630, partial [Anaerolineales bacterium]